MEKEKQKNEFVKDVPKSRFFTILPKGHSFVRLDYCIIEVSATKEVMYRETIFNNAVQIQIMNKDECAR